MRARARTHRLPVIGKSKNTSTEYPRASDGEVLIAAEVVTFKQAEEVRLGPGFNPWVGRQVQWGSDPWGASNKLIH